jgi:hypothetical protein
MSELSGQGPVVHSGATSIIDTSAVCKLGTRGVDVDGNEHVYVDFQQAFIAGEFAAFDSNYAATQLTSSSRGWVGVVIGTPSASDRYGWVMIRGVHTAAWATSGSSAAGQVMIGATTDVGAIDTLATTAGNVGIFGIYLTGSPDTCASTGAGGTSTLTGTSILGVATVILNYPFISGATVVLTS